MSSSHTHHQAAIVLCLVHSSTRVLGVWEPWSSLDLSYAAAADQSRMMQEQMTGAAMAMPADTNKAFKVCGAPFAELRGHHSLTPGPPLATAAHSLVCGPHSNQSKMSSMMEHVLPLPIQDINHFVQCVHTGYVIHLVTGERKRNRIHIILIAVYSCICMFVCLRLCIYVHHVHAGTLEVKRGITYPSI